MSLAGRRLVVILLACLPRAAFALAPSDDGVRRHDFRKGETFHYYFEDTDYQYDLKPEAGLLRPKAARAITNLTVRLRVDVVDVSSAAARRRISFESGTYRTASPEKYNETPALALSSAVPSFPADFGYEYRADGEVVGRTAQFFAPYMGSDAGVFLFYKSLDIHTFQSVIDGISPDQKPGSIALKPGKDIKLAVGTFHNAASILTYDRVETVDGARCAVFKLATPGNRFDGEGKNVLRTDYQLTMFVPLEGPYRGLLLRGELQETVYEKHTYVLRQLSMTLN